MTPRLIAGLIALALAFWGSVAVIASAYGINLFPAHDLLTAVMKLAGPWVGLIGGFMFWKQARVWRRLYYMRPRPSPLSRDPRGRAAPPERPSGLERAARLLMATSGVALVYWFDLPGPEYILAAGLLVWFFKSFALGALRRHGGQTWR